MAVTCSISGTMITGKLVYLDRSLAVHVDGFGRVLGNSVIFVAQSMIAIT